MNRIKIADVDVTPLNLPEATDVILTWCRHRSNRFVVLANAHVIALAAVRRSFAKALSTADMVLPDGAPVAWTLRTEGCHAQRRVPGPDLMDELLRRCQAEALPVYFYGSTDSTLRLLRDRLRSLFPLLNIVGMESPPFGDIAEIESVDSAARINDSGCAVLFVGLGCPKQEVWMSRNSPRISAVMIGVGAAFDFIAGTVNRAPPMFRDNGFEWLYRLVSEPARLWRRYLIYNSVFLGVVMKQKLLRLFL